MIPLFRYLGVFGLTTESAKGQFLLSDQNRIIFAEIQLIVKDQKTLISTRYWRF
jgi:hypothetical protein